MAHLRRLFFGMLTHNTGDSGSDSPIVLIVNQGGADVLHHTFADTSQKDQEQGQANLYQLLVTASNIVPESLTNSSIRVGIRGDDLWRPLHAVVWGQRFTGGAIVPLAIETDLGVGLSTTASEGNISVPIRLVGQGSADMQIRRLLVLMKTANEDDAGTNSKIELQISSGRSILVTHEFPDTPQDDQEKGQANLYFVPVAVPFAKNGLSDDSIRLRIKGSDAWLPSSFFVFGLDDAEGRPESLVPLVHIRSWALGTLSTDDAEGEEAVTLPLV